MLAPKLIVIVNALSAVWPWASVALKVKLNVVSDVEPLSVPLITPVDVLRDKPPGKVPEVLEKDVAFVAATVTDIVSPPEKEPNDPAAVVQPGASDTVSTADVCTAVQTSAVLTVSDAPGWTTAAGSLGSFSGGDTISVTVAATNATSFSKTSGTFPGGLSLNTSTGVISGTESGSTSDTTFSFTLRATDAQGQTADRAFTITINLGANNSGQFN